MAIAEQGDELPDIELELTAAQSQAIFNDFMRWQIERQREEGTRSAAQEESRNAAHYVVNDFPRIQLALGPLRELKSRFQSLAESFSQSEARQAIRTKAASVDLKTLTPQAFQDLLTEVFEDGLVTQERILVVYYFCSDLAIRAIDEEGPYLFQHLMTWSIAYMKETVSTFVARQGGWVVVLNTGLSFVSKIAFTVFCIVAASSLATLILRR